MAGTFEKDSRKNRNRYYNLRKCTLKQYLDKRRRLEEQMDHDDFVKRTTYRDRIQSQLKYEEKKELKYEREMERRKDRIYLEFDFADEVRYYKENED